MLFRQPDMSDEKFLEDAKWVEEGFKNSQRPIGEMNGRNHGYRDSE
jgi:hypothetical protein